MAKSGIFTRINCEAVMILPEIERLEK